MRYLIKRNEFITKRNIESYKKGLNFKEQIKTSSLVRETFENDITWGGSMIGRLINSAIRRFKIGYSQTQVEPLIKKLEDELNYLISASIQGDTLKKYNELLIRSYIEEIRNICLSNMTDPEKLVELLGQSTGLYDPNDPTKNQRTIGIVQEALDVITDDLKDLKKIFGADRDRLIDKLSDFNDDLRKLTVPQDTPTQPTQQGSVSNFNLNFLNALDKLKNSGLVNDSYNFDTKFLTSYKLFTETHLSENVDTNVPTDQKAIAEKPTGSDKEKVNQKYNQLLGSWKKAQQAAGKNTNPGEGTRKRLMSEAEASQKTDKTPQTTGQSPDVSKISKSEVDGVYNLLKSKKDQKDNPEVIKLLNDIETKIPKDKLSSIKVEYDSEEITIGDAIQKLKNETVKESRYIILENNSGMSGQTASGTTASAVDNTSSSPSSEPKSVKDIWDLYEFDDTPGITRLTQREVDELNSLLTKGTQNLRYEPEKRPDPIVSIARIFGEAHNLYFNYVIPSGRPNGRVSQKTFREYIKLGKGPGKWEQGTAPEGPFAVKSIFNKWKTGVEKLLMNQEYRKILANVKFVVPGAEDKFNDNFNTKVFEETDPVDTGTPTTKQSDGQILFQFMNDMLDKNKIDDFDTLRSNLMSKYFGIKMSDKDKVVQSPTPKRDPKKDNTEPNVTYFSSLQNPKIDISMSKFYAIPINKFTGADSKTHDIIFLQVIKNEKVINNNDAILIRFTYDNPIIMTKYHQKNLPNTKYVDWSQKTTAPTKIYYGLMKSTQTDIKNGKKFTLVFGNVNNESAGIVKEIYNRTFKVSEGKRSLASNQEVEVKPSKLVTNDDSSVKDITLPNGFEGKLMTNDLPTHKENLNKMVQSVNKKLIDALKEEFKNL